MRKITFTLFVLIISSSVGFGQIDYDLTSCTDRDTIFIIPENPCPEDSVFLIKTLPYHYCWSCHYNPDSCLFDSTKIEYTNDSILCNAYYRVVWHPYGVDTYTYQKFFIGILPMGYYHLLFTAFNFLEYVYSTMVEFEVVPCENKVSSFKKDSEFKIYPNPAKDYLYIDRKNFNIKVRKIFLYGISGKKIKSFSPQSEKISLKGIPKGFYILDIVCKNENFNYKIIKL
jgi:hypothetical protein